MISWIQNHLIRHGRWIFLTLLSVIIIAFVFTIGNTPGCTTDRSGYQERRFYGLDLNSPRDMRPIAEKVRISSELNRRQIRSEQEFQSALSSRIAYLHLANEIGIPAPTQASLGEYIRTKPAFSGPGGQFSPDAYTRFVDQLESDPRAPQGLIISVLEEDYRIEQLTAVLSGPGFLLPAEAKLQTQRNQTVYDLSLASLNFNSFAPEIDTEDATLLEYYENNAARYEIPERIQASYAFFPSATYAARATTPSEADLRAHFVSNRARFVKAFEAENPSPTPDPENMEPENAEAETEETPAVTFEDVRASVAAELAQAAELRAANEAAQAFALALYREDIGRESAAFNKLLNDTDLALEPIEPFTAEGAARRTLNPQMLESAFILNDKRYYSDPYPVDSGFAILIFEGRIAPVIPPFEEVKAAVQTDYLAETKRRLFNEKGQSLQAELEQKISEGTSFTEAAKTLELTVSEIEAFKAGEAPRSLNPSALQTAQGMKAGEVSPMVTSRGEGLFVYLNDKQIPEIAPDDEDFTQATEFLTMISTSISAAALTNELVALGLPEEKTDK